MKFKPSFPQFYHFTYKSIRDIGNEARLMTIFPCERARLMSLMNELLNRAESSQVDFFQAGRSTNIPKMKRIQLYSCQTYKIPKFSLVYPKVIAPFNNYLLQFIVYVIINGKSLNTRPVGSWTEYSRQRFTAESSIYLQSHLHS